MVSPPFFSSCSSSLPHTWRGEKYLLNTVRQRSVILEYGRDLLHRRRRASYPKPGSRFLSSLATASTNYSASSACLCVCYCSGRGEGGGQATCAPVQGYLSQEQQPTEKPLMKAVDLRELPRLVEWPRKKKATLVEFGEVKRLPSDRHVLLDLHQHVGCAQWRLSMRAMYR